MKLLLRILALLALIGCAKNAYSADGGGSAEDGVTYLEFQRNPLIQAIKTNNPQTIADALSKEGQSANVKTTNGHTALMEAAKYCDNINCYQTLLNGPNSKRADPYAIEKLYKYNALMFAIDTNRSLEIIDLLASATGAVLDHQNKFSKNVLHMAVVAANVPVVELLIDKYRLSPRALAKGAFFTAIVVAGGIEDQEKRAQMLLALEIRNPKPRGTCTIL